MKRRPVRWIALLFGAAVALQEVSARVSKRDHLRAEPVDLPAAVAVHESHGPFPGSSGLLMPVRGVKANNLRDGFGDKRGARVHQAIDIMAPRGTPVVAVSDGKIVKLYVSKAGGKTFYLSDPSGTRQYYYAHLDQYAPHLVEGLEVKRGEVLGTVGTTGNASPGAPHLHFAIEELAVGAEWWKGEAINPYPVLTGR